MDFIVNKKKLNINPSQFMRQAGYGFIIDRRSGNETFIRRLSGGGHYPRFHAYVTDDENKIKFSLHLDQKQAMYPGQHAHNAEYDGLTVEREVARLKSLLKKIYISMK